MSSIGKSGVESSIGYSLLHFLYLCDIVRVVCV